MVTLGTALVLMAAVWVFQSRQREPTPSSAQPGFPPQASGPLHATPPPAPAPAGTSAPADTAPAIEAWLAQLRSNPDPTVARGKLSAWQRELAGLSPAQASAHIRAFLDTGEDTRTGLEFKIGPNGTLSASPTLRVFLLDQLGRVNPEEAARYAEIILASPSSSDEWAVAMKYYAQNRSGAESEDYLRGKLRQMWSQESWNDQPSVGFLEAFDVAVQLGGTELISDLTAMVRDRDRRATGHAAYLALDRMTIRDAITTLTLLQSEPELMEGREQTRANYFARADVRDPNQQLILADYLLDPSRRPEELDTFAHLFPNANYMVSYNLLTPVITPSGSELADLDRTALAVIRRWREEERFESLKLYLDIMERRLDQFAKSP